MTRTAADADRRAEQLLELAQQLACDVRDDLATCHRIVGNLDRIDLEGLVVVLAALVDVDRPVDAWWQAGEPPRISRLPARTSRRQVAA